jgi:hypothetical protein
LNDLAKQKLAYEQAKQAEADAAAEEQYYKDLDTSIEDSWK